MKSSAFFDAGRIREVQWNEASKSKRWPDGVVRQWIATVDRMPAITVFQVIGGEDRFVLCYHEAGEPKPTVEKHSSFQSCYDRGNLVLSQKTIIVHG